MDYSALLIRNTTKMEMNSIFNFYKISFKMLFEECYHLILLNFTQALRSWKTAKDKNSPILCVLENGLLLRPTRPHMSQKIIADGPSFPAFPFITLKTSPLPLLWILLNNLLIFSNPDPWVMGTLSDVKTNAQLLKGRVDNVSTLSSEIKRTRGGMEAAGVQIQMVNASLDHIHSHIRRLETDVKKANAQIQMLMKSWEEVDDLNAQIPQLKNDLDKASALNTKVRALQSSLENTSKLLKRQSK